MREKKLTRRDFLRSATVATAGAVAAACAPATPKVVEVEKEVPVEKEVVKTVVVEKEVPVEKTVVKEVGVKRVPRERCLVLMMGGSAGAFTDTGIGGPYATGFTHQYGNNAWLEPLFYYSAFADKWIPWLAEDYKYNEDFTEVVIKIRKGVEWSDGHPFTAKDVAFTINMVKDHAPKLRNSAEFAEWVKECTAVDDYTVKLTFTAPNPRFVFCYLSFKFDTGQYIVPEHIYKDVDDPTTFTFYDPDKGWPVVTGPYRITMWTPSQKFEDLREDWWGAKTGFAPLPKVERIINLPWSDETKASELAIRNVVDATLDLRPATIKTVLDQNPKVITHTFREKPWGYIDWWPISLCFNDLEPPFNDPDIRWAISYAIDREKAVEMGWLGAGQPTTVPFPYYPALMPYIDSIKDLLEEYPTNEYNPAKTEKLMKSKGYTKDAEGFWTKDGKRFTMEIGGWAIFADLGPIVAEQLRKAGFEASYTMPADLGTRISQGKIDSFFFGHGGSIADPFLTLSLYHSRLVKPTGEPGYPAWRWKNKEFDAIVDEMSTVPMGDPRVKELFHKAMEIWLRELPTVPFVQWYHRIPMNTTYWEGWPTEKDPYVNGAFWHLTFPMILRRLKPTT